VEHASRSLRSLFDGGRARGRLLVLFMPLILGACALMALGLQKPEVSVAGLDLQEANLFEQKLRIKLRVANPNERDIAIDGMHFSFEVNGHEFANGMTGESTVLPRLGETYVMVDARTSLVQILTQLPALLDSNGKLAYRISGDVITHDYGRIPFDRKGELSPEEIGKKLLPPETTKPVERGTL